MDLKIVKEKEPQLKLKKEAEVAVHTKNYLSSVKKGTLVFRKKPDVDILGYRKKEAAGKGDTEGGLSGRRKNAVKKQLSENVRKGKAQNSQKIPELSSKDADIPADVSPAQILQNAGIPVNREAKEKYRREQAVRAVAGDPKKMPKGKELAVKGLKKGGTAFLTQMEGGEEVNESLYVLDTLSRPAGEVLEKQKYLRAEKELKIKQADGKISSRQFKKEAKLNKKKIAEKTKNQAVRQRKLQYVINKLTGSGEQDSLLQMAKDIVKMKMEFLMLKAVKFMGVLLAPLFGIILAAAVPVVLVFYMLYASPMAAFMPNPSEENPAVREVLGGYYAQFNAELMETNGGQAGKELSGGMRQRLGMALALLNNPQVLIVDEPTAGLDPEERIRIRNMLVSLASEKMVILSTHIVEDISSTCKKVAVLHEGELLFNGDVEELKNFAAGKVFVINQTVNDELPEEMTLISKTQEKLRVLSDVPPTSRYEVSPPSLEDGYMELIRKGM